MAVSVCVFCGSNLGTQPRFREAAAQLGAQIGKRGMRLVYGGSHLGLMGTVADAVLAAGGEVTGVVPTLLIEKEAAYKELADLRVVSTMHERKALMVDLSDGFITLPGAYGTLDELFECVTWAQLKIHQKPVVIWNIDGYFTRLFEFLDHAVECGLLRPGHRTLLREATSLDDVFRLLEQSAPEPEGKIMPREIR
jgi:uncharacterized protein (TIGR00730 family)